MRNSTESYPVKLSLALLLAGIMGHPTFMHSAALASEPAATPISPDSKERVAPRTLKEAGITTTEIIGQTSDAPTTTPSPASPTTPTDPVYSTIPAQVGGSFTSGPGAGYDRSFVGIDGFVPLMQTPGKDLTYLQGRLLLSTDGGNPGGNVLVGYRRFSPATNSILGGYVGYDVRDTGRATFNQLGAGVEGIWSRFEARINGYLPIGDTRRTVDRSSGILSSIDNSSTTTTIGDIRFQGNSLLNDLITTNRIATAITRFNSKRDQAALGGFDAEAGMKLAQWDGDGDLRSYLGLYYYSGSNVGGFVGVRGRLAANITKNFSAGLSVQGDPEFGTTAAVTVGFRFPGVGSRSNETKDEKNESRSNWARMGDSPSRSNTVAVTERTDTQINTVVQNSTTSTNTTVVAINPATNQPYVFQHAVLGNAGGSGTFESPFGTVAAAITAAPGDGNGIVYVQSGTNPGIPAFTIKDGVQVLSTGPVQTLATVQQGNVRLPLSGSGTLPTVTGTVTLGNNNTLSGFRIAGFAGNGITGTGVSNVIVRDNQIANVTSGINLTGASSNVTIQDNQVTNTGASNAVNLNGAFTGTWNILRNTVTNTGGTGIFFATSNAAGTNVTATIANNTLANNQDVAILAAQTGAGTLRVTILNNQTVGALFGGGSQVGVFVRATNGQIFADVRDNRVNNPAPYVPPDRVEFQVLTTAAAGRICLRLQGNSAPNTGFLVGQFGVGGPIQFEPQSGNTGTLQPTGGGVTAVTPNVAAGTCGFP